MAINMQPHDPYNPQPDDLSAPQSKPYTADHPMSDLPDAALPGVDPVMTQPATPSPTHQPQHAAPPAPTPPPPTPASFGVPAPSPAHHGHSRPTGHNPRSQQAPSQAAQSPPGDQGRSHLTAVGKKYFKLIEFDDKEVLLAEIRKHPFGLFIIFVIGGFVACAVLAAAAAIAASGFLNSVGFGSSSSVVVFIGFLFSLFVAGATLINAHLYRNNVVFVTNEKLAQVLFITLFNRKISQLSIGDVQDVTVQQNGFLPNLVGYGTLVVETAGEQQNYTFTFVPHPYETSKIIIGAHEDNLRLYGN